MSLFLSWRIRSGDVVSPIHACLRLSNTTLDICICDSWWAYFVGIKFSETSLNEFWNQNWWDFFVCYTDSQLLPNSQFCIYSMRSFGGTLNIACSLVTESLYKIWICFTEEELGHFLTYANFLCISFHLAIKLDRCWWTAKCRFSNTCLGRGEIV